MKWLKRIGLVCLPLLLAGAYVVFGILPERVGREMNAIGMAPPYTVSAEVQALHDSLLVADLHADSLLWCRDLAQKSDWGQVDIPRMRLANVAIQAFTAVTKSPKGQNIHSNSADATDKITQLVMAQRWPIRTWFSLKARALYQAQVLRDLAEADPNLDLLRTAMDVNSLYIRRSGNREALGVFLGIEGLHCLEGDLANIQALYDAGYRMMGPTHFFDNDMGGSAHGESGGGLTDFGRQAVQKMNELNIIIDLAHASPAMIDDVLDLTTRPVVLSHGGIKGTCDNERNLSDEHVRRIAEGGGLIGIGVWETAVCGTDAAATARAMKYVADLAGVEHVALGSDFDGAIEAPFDVTGLPLLTESLMQTGFSEDDIRKIMGGNARAFLSQNLPGK